MESLKTVVYEIDRSGVFSRSVFVGIGVDDYLESIGLSKADKTGEQDLIGWPETKLIEFGGFGIGLN